MRPSYRFQWVHQLKGKIQRYWMPLLLGIVATVAVFGVWQQLEAQEQLHIQQLVQQETNAVESELNRELSTRVLVLERMASRWQASGGTPKALWEADAANNVDHYYGYQAIEWVDSSFHVRWVVPLKGNEAAQNLDLSQESRRQITLSVARDLRQTILTRTVLLAQGGKGFLAVVPLFVQDSANTRQVDHFDGFVVGAFQFQSLFDSILKISPRYQVQIYDRNGLIYSQGNPSPAALSNTGIVQAYGADWQIQIFPTSAMIAAEKTALPTVVLWGGVTGAWILALMVYLGQRAAYQTRYTRKINQQLKDEITHRQQAEASLRASEERWKLAVHGNNDGIWDWNVQTNEVFFSHRFKEMLGFEDHEISHHLDKWLKRVHPDDLEWVMQAVQDHFARKNPFYATEHRVLCKDGSYKWILDRGQAIWDEGGNVIRMVGSHTDITERKQAEIALQISETKYRNLIEHLNAGFIVHTTDNRIVQCNATACDLLGLSMAQMLGNEAIDPAWHFVREDGTVMPVEEYPVNRILSTQVPLENYVVGINRGSQSRVWVLVTAFPEFDINHQLKQIVVTLVDISKLKQAEANLQEMAGVMENALTGISKLNVQGHYLYVNKAYADITGYQPEAMIGMLWHQTVHPDDLEQLTTAYQQMVHDGKVEVEARGIRQDGSSFYKQLVMISAYDEQQQFVGHYCFMKDISDRKQAEVALQNSQARFAGILEIASDAIITVNANQQITLFNRGAERIFGYKAEEVLGQPLSLLMPDRFAQAHHHHVRQYAQTADGARQMAQRGTIFGRRKDGTEFPAEASISKLSLNGEVTFTTFLQDITARQQAEMAMAHLAAIIESSEDAIVSRSLEGIVKSWNAAAEKLFGYTAAEMVGQSVQVLIPEALQNEESSILERIQEGKRITTYDTQRRRKDGSFIDVSISISPIKDAEGRIVGASKIARDISERKQLEAQRQRAEEELRQSEEKFRMAIDFTYNWEYWQAPDGTFAYVSPSCERITGYTPNEFIEYSELIHTIVHPDDRAILNHHICHATVETEFVEYRIITLSGETRWISHICQPVFNSNREFLGIRATNRDISERKRIEGERKQAELALQESEERFRVLVTHAPVGIFQTNAQGQCLYVNPRWMELTGLSFSEAMGDGWEKSLHPDDRKAVFTEWVQATEAGHSFSLEYRFQKPDGKVTWVSGQAITVRDETGAISRYFGTVMDITARKQAEIALQESEARFQAFMNHSPTAAWITNMDGIVLYTNQTYLRSFQLPTTDLVGKSIFKLYPTEMANQFLENIQTVAQTQQVLETIEVAPRRNGLTGDFLVYKFPIPDSCGSLLVGGVAIDITQQHQAEEDLRYQKEMFQAIVDHIPVMVALFNAQGQIEFINPELERILGWSLEDWQQRNILLDCYPDPTYRQGVLNHMLAATGNWKDVTTLNAHGQSLETSWANVPLSGGRFLGIGQDISDRKCKEVALRQAVEAAEAANLAKSMFLANMSHELRTPLNVILGFTQVMAHDLSLTPSQKDDLQTIRRSGDHLLNLINDVLDLSKIEAGHCTFEETGFDLISLLHTLRTMMAERAKAKQLQMIFDIAPDVPQFVIADEQKIRQILLNLLSNAVKFTKQGGVTLRVKSWESQEKLCSAYSIYPIESNLNNFTASPACTLQFEVIDTGVGIAAAEQDAIFDAFVQAEAGRKSISGTGLGLTISRKLLELMNGEISVHSIPTIGSTFTVTVPVCPTSGIDPQPKQCDRMVIGLVPGQPHRRVLVVDDQLENRLVMVRLLAQLGLEVQEATNGQEAIYIWQEWQPDLTWMDIRMPVLDGYEATKQIRAMEQEKASIIIALTAQASQSDRTLALAAGCNDYISKPFQEETVFLKMAEHLGLEYLYAEPTLSTKLAETLSPYPFQTKALDPDQLTHPTMLDLSVLPPKWLAELEAAASCCDDAAVIKLVTQLSPELKQLAAYLIKLANQYEFEQILQLLQPISSI